MTLVKYQNEVVRVVSRNQTSLRIVTSENEVKNISAEDISSVSHNELNKKLQEIMSGKIVSLQHYRIIKQQHPIF